eukprot:GHVP01033895.1.p1 GENE.GHVP01033895.1~~GHVP01033895.1.p1  ORF type:complete len:135 (+),score=22.07 GHVP01033895.1:136-540(+)
MAINGNSSNSATFATTEALYPSPSENVSANFHPKTWFKSRFGKKGTEASSDTSQVSSAPIPKRSGNTLFDGSQGKNAVVTFFSEINSSTGLLGFFRSKSTKSPIFKTNVECRPQFFGRRKSSTKESVFRKATPS